jgi:hypothetical protein
VGMYAAILSGFRVLEASCMTAESISSHDLPYSRN